MEGNGSSEEPDENRGEFFVALMAKSRRNRKPMRAPFAARADWAHVDD